MKRELLMPKLGLTMAEGVLLEWLVRPGEPFQAEQSLFVVESEKAAVEIPADAAGTLLQAVAEPGATLAVGTVIGYWDDGTAASADGPAGQAGAADAPANGLVAPVSGASSAAPVDIAPDGRSPHDPQPARVLATPLARRLARERGVDLRAVVGHGPRGRIRARDLPEAAGEVSLTGAATVPAQASAAAMLPGPAPDTPSLRPPTAVEATVARRLTAAKQEVPHFYLAREAEVSAVQTLRAELNAAQATQRYTLNHFVLAAVGRALAAMPQVNRVWTAEGILTLPSLDVGMAVHTERGLLVPVLRDAGRQALGELARSADAAAQRAQAGRLGPQEMSGGAITVSNAGMHDVTYMSSIINPGQAMILGVGSVRGVFRPDPQGRPVLRQEMGLVLSADHRVLDGVTALRLLRLVAQALERPLGLLVP